MLGIFLAAVGIWYNLAGGMTDVLAQHPAPDIRFDRDIVPILQAKCLACHNKDLESSGFVVETYERLMKGGDKGPAIVPGHSNESRLVLMIEGKLKPKMPLQGELKPEEIQKIKTWIDAGARPPESTTMVAALPKANIPDIKPRVALLPQVSSLAFRPDGGRLAAAGYKQVQLIDAVRGEIAGRLSGPSDVVRAVAYSPDGKWLAAAGGAPARAGEVVIWNAASGELVHTIKGHNDYIYAVAFSPDSTLLATSSYDKLVKLWDVATGRELKTLKDHTDAVFPVAFSPDGKRLASGAADRTVKIWEVASGRRLFTLSDALDTIYALAFHPSENQISAGGADKMIRTWDLTPEGGTLVRSTIAHEDAIIQLAYSPDGKIMVSAASDRLIKIWDVKNGLEIKMLEKQPDWAMALAFSPDGQRLAIGRYDGSISIYEVASGRRVLDPVRVSDSQVGLKAQK